MSFSRLCLLLLLVPFAAGCAPLVKAEQPEHPETILLESGKTAGQTFLARYDGLRGIELFLEPGDPGQGELRLHLSASPEPGAELAAGSLDLGQVTTPGFYHFSFHPLANSAGRDYSFRIDLEGTGSVRIGRAPGDAYLHGSLYLNRDPADGQLAFRLSHDPGLAISGLARESLSWLAWLVVAGLLFILPGWGLLGLLMPGWPSLSWAERLGLATGVSLALYPLLFLWTGLVGMRLGALYAWLPALGGFALLLWQTYRPGRLKARGRTHRPASGARPPSPRYRPLITRTTAADLALLVVIGVTFAVRFWSIRNLDLPMWGDSVQHTLIAQLLVDHGGLFNIWEPYAELQTFTYHFGFHTLVAAFHWITRLSLPQSTLIAGQILNGLAVLALYPLAIRLGRRRSAGVAAVLLAGLLAPMPMYYVNWGRYTELAGLAILPAAIYLAWEALESVGERVGGQRIEKRGRKVSPSITQRMVSLSGRLTSVHWLSALTCITLCGLALTHYRVALFAVLFFPVYLLLHLNLSRLKPLAARTLLIGTGTGLLFLPWFVRLLSGRLLQVFGDLVSTPARQLPAALEQGNAIGNLFTYLPAWMWLSFLVAVGWGLWRRERGATLFVLWWFAILLSANPAWLGLPGTGILSNFAVFIAAFFPAGVVIGAATGWVAGSLAGYRWKETGWARRNGSKRRERELKSIGVEALAGGLAEQPEEFTGLRVPGAGGQASPASPFTASLSEVKNRGFFSPFQIILLLAVLSLSLWGGRERLRDLDVQGHALATRPDLRAFAWIQDNTSQTARFLVNSFPAYGGSLVVGSDAGWWLPQLAHRSTTLPPINYGSERGPQPDYLAWTNQLTFALLEKGPRHPEVLEMLHERGVTHVYIGQRQGRIGAGARLSLPVAELASSPDYRVVYHEDRVWIFELLNR